MANSLETLPIGPLSKILQEAISADPSAALSLSWASKKMQPRINSCLQKMWEYLGNDLSHAFKEGINSHLVKAWEQINQEATPNYSEKFFRLYERSELMLQEFPPFAFNGYQHLLAQEGKFIHSLWANKTEIIIINGGDTWDLESQGLYTYITKMNPELDFVPEKNAPVEKILDFAQKTPTAFSTIKKLNIDRGQLSSIGCRLINCFKDLNTLEYFSSSGVSNNLFIGGISLKKLENLSVVDCGLKRISQIKCEKLKSIDLSNNEIKAFPKLSSCKRKFTIILKSNKINKIENSDIIKNENIHSINILYNPLKRIHISKKFLPRFNSSSYFKFASWELNEINLDIDKKFILKKCRNKNRIPKFDNCYPMLICDQLLEQFPKDPKVIAYNKQLSHRASSTLSKLYQKILSAKTRENLESKQMKEEIKALFDLLDQGKKCEIYPRIYAKAIEEGICKRNASLPFEEQQRWGELNAHNQPFLLGLAVRDFIVDKCRALITLELEKDKQTLIQSSLSEACAYFSFTEKLNKHTHKIKNHVAIFADALP